MIPDPKDFQQIKFGSGVLGKTAPVVGGLLVPIIAGMYFLQSFPWMVFSLVILAILVVCGFLSAAFWYGNKHPDAAVLEGAELVRYRELELAAKDSTMIDVTPLGSANTAPPQSITVEGPRNG